MSQKILLGLLCAALPMLAMAPGNQDPDSAQAPRASDPIQVERHSSKWRYPSEISLGPGQDLHIVVKGDTLWDLGQRYLGSPFAWPQIWELNRWVEDPHWIYPGDPLIVPSDRTVIGEDEVSQVATLPPDGRIFKPITSWIGYAYAYQDFLQLPYLTPKGASAHFRELDAVKVTGNQKEDRHNSSKGDVVYLGGGLDKGLQVGDKMLVLKVPKQKLVHPDDKLGLRPLGDVIQHAATLRVLSVHSKNAEAVIEDTLDGVEIGDYATSYVEPALILTSDAPLREDILEPIQLNTAAKIIYGRSDASYFSTGSLVLIDKGARAGLQVGDVLVGVRSKSLVNESLGAGKDAPETNKYLGQLLVVKSEADSSTCVVIYTKGEMTLGDLVTN